MADRLNLTRDQLTAFLKDHQAVKQFENLFGLVNTVPTLATKVELAATEAALVELVNNLAVRVELDGGAGISTTQTQSAPQSEVLLWLSM